LPFFIQSNKSVDNSIYFHIHFISAGKVNTHNNKKQNGKKCNGFGQDLHKGENIKQMVENLEFAVCLNEKVKDS